MGVLDKDVHVVFEMSSWQSFLEITTNLADHANVKVFLYLGPVAPVPETIEYVMQASVS